MNILKNFEALFVVTLGLACAANYVLDDHVATEQTVAQLSAPAASANSAMSVVVVSAKRLSPEQKKQALVEERHAASKI
jgi:hypothetical protein